MENTSTHDLYTKMTLWLLVICSLLLFGMKNVHAETEKKVPTSFEWSGGSGRLKGIECQEFYEEDGIVWAKIAILSSNYIYIKVNEEQYDRTAQASHYSEFLIPVVLNEKMKIQACTTAMSKEHEVEYTIKVNYDPDAKPVEKAENKPEIEADAGMEEKTLEESMSEETEKFTEAENTEEIVEDVEEEIEEAEEREETIPEIEGLTYEKKMELRFAKEFDVYYYTEDYKVIRVYNDRDFLLIPEGKEVPENTGDMVILSQSPEHIYLAATAIMSLFDSLDALDHIRLTSMQAFDWYIENAVSAMKEEKIIFAGKYSEPDYELLLGESCDLAIESTMILHSPKVQEMLEDMGIPVFIDRSSYEEHPLGRTEWVKLYGALLNKEDIAEIFFKEQADIIDQLEDFTNTEKTVAFFYIGSDGSVVVRKAEDYVPRMIEIAGGRYLFDHLSDETGKKSSVNLTMEEFYATACDADYLVYNATIDDPIYTLEDLYQKDELFTDFKAVKEGNVWCAGKYLYQATDIVGNMIKDLHLMLTGGDESEMTFMTKIQ